MTITTANAKIIREFFTDDQWDAISSALADYQDYGEEEQQIASAIDSKITALFN